MRQMIIQKFRSNEWQLALQYRSWPGLLNTGINAFLSFMSPKQNDRPLHFNNSYIRNSFKIVSTLIKKLTFILQPVKVSCWFLMVAWCKEHKEHI